MCSTVSVVYENWWTETECTCRPSHPSNSKLYLCLYLISMLVEWDLNFHSFNISYIHIICFE